MPGKSARVVIACSMRCRTRSAARGWRAERGEPSGPWAAECTIDFFFVCKLAALRLCEAFTHGRHVFLGNVEDAVVGSGNLFNDLGGVGLPFFRQRFQFLDGDFQGFHHAGSIAQRGCGDRIWPQKAVGAGRECLLFVLMSWDETKGDWWLRLGDLAALSVRAQRGIFPGFLQASVSGAVGFPSLICSFVCGVRGVIGAAGSALRFSMSARAERILSRGWSGWWR